MYLIVETFDGDTEYILFFSDVKAMACFDKRVQDYDGPVQEFRGEDLPDGPVIRHAIHDEWYEIQLVSVDVVDWDT